MEVTDLLSGCMSPMGLRLLNKLAGYVGVSPNLWDVTRPGCGPFPLQESYDVPGSWPMAKFPH